jgi:hypothetical protein
MSWTNDSMRNTPLLVLFCKNNKSAFRKLCFVLILFFVMCSQTDLLVSFPIFKFVITIINKTACYTKQQIQHFFVFLKYIISFL